MVTGLSELLPEGDLEHSLLLLIIMMIFLVVLLTAVGVPSVCVRGFLVPDSGNPALPPEEGVGKRSSSPRGMRAQEPRTWLQHSCPHA